MLKEVILVDGSCHIMMSHSDFFFKKYAKEVDKVFKKILRIQTIYNGNLKKFLKVSVKFAKFKNQV